MRKNRFRPRPSPSSVPTATGQVRAVPPGWELLPPGDAALTRRVKAAGDHWVMQEKKGRRIYSRGVWAPAATIERIRGELAAERSTVAYDQRRQSDAKRRKQVQVRYVEDFFAAVIDFLAFHDQHVELARGVARAVADHATPIGSGTVARTKRIPLAERAEAAVIAWMRHQTTGYDGMEIPREKGKRRQIRRMLAERSRDLLGCYRTSAATPAHCPLQQALGQRINCESGEQSF